MKYVVIGCLALLLIVCYLNWKYEVIAFHPFRSEGQHNLKVMTWNVHCSNGAESVRQRRIAELILEVDADFVMLNEYYQDSCQVVDSILRTRYEFTKETNSHRKSGDIFYSKRKMKHAGRVRTPKNMKRIQTIKATIAVGGDSVQIFGLHMASNHYDDNTFDEEMRSDTTSYDRYKDAQEKRRYQAHWTKEAAMKSKHPVIVMGDMNDFNCSAPLDTFTTNGLRDAWWEAGFGYGHTFHQGWLRLRIDHILHSRELRLECIRVIDTDLSDHNPVVAGFSLNTNTRSSSARSY